MPSDFILQVRWTLERTTERLRGLVTDAPLEIVAWKPSPAEWSVEEVLAHLVQTEEVHLDRLRAILEGRTITAFDQNEAVKETSSWMVMPTQLMDQFARARLRSLPEVEKVRDEQLRLMTNHTELGPVTMRMLLADWATSDLAHTRQIIKLLIQPFYRELGPWQKYYKNSTFTG